MRALETFWHWRSVIQVAQDGEAVLVWDIETPGLNPAGPTLCTGWALGLGRATVHWGNMLEAAGPFLKLLTPGIPVVAHNIKYEAQSLIARGIDPRQFVWWDTMLGEWVRLANNPHGQSIGLDESAQRYGCEPKDPETDALIKAGKVLEVSQEKLTARNAKDVEDTAVIFYRQIAEMTEEQVRLTIVRSMMAIELAYIELEGMGLDPVRVKAECDRNAEEIRVHEDALREITKGANPRSVNEMAPVLYGLWPETVKLEDRVGIESLGFAAPAKWVASKGDKNERNKPSKGWPEGKPSIARETMEVLARKSRTPRQKLWAKHYLALCDAISERDKNLAHFAEVVANGGVIYAELHQGVTATHRLSCRSKPNPAYDYGCQLQNVPRHLKGCLVPKRKGWKAFSVDQSQAEFRGAIWLADDEQGRADIDNPRFDAHIQTLTVMLNGPENFQPNYDSLFDRYKAGDKEVKWQRADNDLCKGHTFKPLFGGSSGTDRERAYYKWFGQRYSGVTAAQQAWDNEVQATRRMTTPTGLTFHWDTKFQSDWKGRSRMTNHVGRSLYSIVRNIKIQYFATGELAMVSTLCLLYEAREIGLRYACVMLIHDDTSGEIHPEDVEAGHEACKRAYGEQTYNFLASVYDIDYDIELASESKAGLRFGHGESEATHAYRNPITPEDRDQMKIAAKSGGSFAPKVKAGTHLALINAVVDLGVQKGSAKFPAPKRKLYVGFEFPAIQVEYKQENGTVEKAPARLGRFLAVSMHEKATLRKLIQSMLGKTFTDTEASQYDLKNLLGLCVMAPVSHKVVGEDTYANVDSPVPLPEGFPNPYKLADAPLYYDTDAHDPLAFAALPEFLQTMINEQVKYSDAPRAADAPQPLSGGLPDLGNDKDIPF